ncbi:unnamed protein product [Adineta ricciae]|uniref:MAM domain-containing protein n=1 Tax=Adineta ricciae TaxID=249248 RepID=A0A814L9J2_ADIRI|nr:unnamed protein product [Adineta ricciae]
MGRLFYTRTIVHRQVFHFFEYYSYVVYSKQVNEIHPDDHQLSSRSIRFVFRPFPCRRIPVGSSNVGSSHFPAVSCKLRAGNGQELIGYFLCNSSRNPAARNLPELAGIGENCVGTDSDFNGSSRRNDRPGKPNNPILGSENSGNPCFGSDEIQHAIPSPGFHRIRRIPVGSDKILYWIRWDPIYVSVTLIQTRILYECNFDNAIITNSCFVGQNTYIIPSKGIGKASRDAPVAPLSDVTSSLKLTSNGQKCKLPYKVTSFSWSMYFCNEGFCPTQSNQKTACSPGQFGYYEFWANAHKVSFILNTLSSGVSGVNRQCLIYYYYLTNLPNMVDKITVRKIETVDGSSVIDTVTNSSQNGWIERRVSFNAARTGYKIYFDLERVSGPILSQSYIAIDEISIHQDDCSRVTTTLSTTIKTTSTSTTTATTSTSTTTATTSTSTTTATTSTSTTTATTRSSSKTTTTSTSTIATLTLVTTSPTTIATTQVPTTITTTQIPTTLPIVQTAISTIFTTMTEFIATTSSTILESVITNTEITITPSTPTEISTILSTVTTNRVTRSSTVVTTPIASTDYSTTAKTSIPVSTLSMSQFSYIPTTESITSTRPATSSTVQLITTISQDNDKDSSDKDKTLILALSIAIPSLLIIGVVSISIWIKASMSAGTGLLGSATHPFTDIAKHKELSTLVEMDELSESHHF